MEMIKETEIKQYSGRGYMFALFKCPKCDNIVELPKHQGKNQLQCQKCFREYHKKTQIKHGDRYTRLYRIWINMRQRCLNKNSRQYNLYGAKGIKIYNEWNKYENFKKWALANGYSDNLTIDRIDPNGNYEPSNCQFIPREINAGKNKIKVSKELYLKIKKDIKNGLKIKDIKNKYNISYSAFYNAKRRYEND